jgi:hypothetical protein
VSLCFLRGGGVGLNGGLEGGLALGGGLFGAGVVLQVFDGLSGDVFALTILFICLYYWSPPRESVRVQGTILNWLIHLNQ